MNNSIQLQICSLDNPDPSFFSCKTGSDSATVLKKARRRGNFNRSVNGNYSLFTIYMNSKWALTFYPIYLNWNKDNLFVEAKKLTKVYIYIAFESDTDKKSYIIRHKRPFLASIHMIQYQKTFCDVSKLYDRIFLNSIQTKTHYSEWVSEWLSEVSEWEGERTRETDPNAEIMTSSRLSVLDSL